MIREAWNRLRPVVEAAASVSVVLVAINAAFVVMNRIKPRWLEVVVAGGGFVETSHAKVFAAREELDDPYAPKFQTVALLGLSGAREAMSVELLEETDGVDARYLALCGAGGAMDSIEDLAQALFDYDFVPDLVVLGVSPHLLIEPPPPSEIVRQDDPTASEQKGLVLRARELVKSLLQLRARRADIAGIWSARTSEFRRWFLRSMGEPVRADGVEPWGELWHADWPERATQRTIDGMLSGYGRRGCYEAEMYHEEPGLAQAASLRRLITRLAERGSRILVFMVPEASALRARIPDAGVQALESAIPSDAEDRVEILNYREALEDWEFVEVSHANRYGKEKFSAIIGPRIGELLGGSQPPSR